MLRSPVSPFCCRRNMRHADETRNRDIVIGVAGPTACCYQRSPLVCGTNFGGSSPIDDVRAVVRLAFDLGATSARPRRDRPPAWAVTSQVAIAIVFRDSRVTLLPSSVSAGWHSPRRDSLHQAASNTAKRSSRRSTPIGATPSCRRPPRRTAQQAQHEVSRHVDALANWRSK